MAAMAKQNNMEEQIETSTYEKINKNGSNTEHLIVLSILLGGSESWPLTAATVKSGDSSVVRAPDS